MLAPETADPDPLAEFARWLADAFASGIQNADACAVATAAADGRPSVRFVLCKGADARGFVFYTNTESRKAGELAENAQAALAFYWSGLGRQVRVTGHVEPVSRDEAEAYFRSRPFGSQLGAWVSPQSRPIRSREELESLVTEVTERYRAAEPPLPPHWGGYRVVPREIELWQHREDRLHDRVLYTRVDDGWRRERLAP